MTMIRLSAIGTLALVAIYFGFRAVVASCSGAGCDVYIPFSLLIPLLILGMTAMTGVVSSLRARQNGGWFPVLLASTAIGDHGPLVALAIFRDRPDSFVFAGTVLALVAPVISLTYSVVEDRRFGGRTE